MGCQDLRKLRHLRQTTGKTTSLEKAIMAIIELDQRFETPITEYRRGAFLLRYGYSRSKDAYTENLRGEDYLVVKVDGNQLAFAVCDGVGSSFFGGLAAQIVGEKLIGWLWDHQTQEKLSSNPEPKVAINHLASVLNAETKFASQLLAKKDIKALSSPFLRSHYEKIFTEIGSQSNFVCGYIEVDTANPALGDVWLFWLGDARMRVWNNREERSQELNGQWLSEQSWSTKHGVLGEIFAFHSTLDKVSQIFAYSDGLEPYEHTIEPAIGSDRLNQIFDESRNASGSDDISFLDISFIKDLPKHEDDLVSALREHVSEKEPLSEIQDEDISSDSEIEEKRSDKKKSRYFLILRAVGVFLLTLSILIIGFLFGYNYQILIQGNQTELPIPVQPSLTPFSPLSTPTFEIVTNTPEPPLTTQPIPSAIETLAITESVIESENDIPSTAEVSPTFTSTQLPESETYTPTPPY